MKLLTPDPARIMRVASLPLILAAGLALAVPSLAAAPPPQQVGFSDLMQAARNAGDHTVAHYVTDTGPGFIFDTMAPKPLLRFDGSVEMWVLTPSQAPRGDTVYTNDAGQVMLRAPKIGGMTVYPPHNTKGIAASFDQPATKRLGLAYILNQAAFDLPTEADGALIDRVLPKFEGLDVGRGEVPAGKDAQWAGLMVDASHVVAETITRLAQTPANRKTLDKITFVRISYAAAPSVKLNKTELLIEIAPVLGIPGRPSSAKIEAALGIH